MSQNDGFELDYGGFTYFIDCVVLLEGIWMGKALEYLNKHEGLLEMSVNLMVSKEWEYLKQDRNWINENVLYQITHFMYSLTKENKELWGILSGIQDIGDYIKNAIENMNESNIHIVANLCGLSFNLWQEEFYQQYGQSEAFVTLVQQPLTKIIVLMKSPQLEFNEGFAENLEHIKEAISSNNEDEESISNEAKKPTSAKLAQMMSDFLNEMGVQVKKWKNYSLGNITALEILSQILSSSQDSANPNRDAWVKSSFLEAVQVGDEVATLFGMVLKRIEVVQMKVKVDLEDMHGIGKVVFDVQTAAWEVLINLLVSYPDMFYDENSEEDSKRVVDTLLNSLKHQSYNSKIVECGLRFLALYAKNYPNVLKLVLEEHKAGDSFLELIESVKDQEIIAHGLSIISALYTKVEQTLEENKKVCMLLIHHCQSPYLRVVWESLNAFFDIYSEENYDSVLEELKAIPFLENELKRLEKQFQEDQDKYEEEELEFFGEVFFNLEQFIKYKHDHM
jgi:hypothetical protein